MGDDKLLKKRVEFSEILLKEAMPFMTDQPRVWARQFGDQVTFGETFGKVALARVPFSSTSLRHDVLVFHDIPTREGLLHVVHIYSGQAILPADFSMTIPFNIPYAAWAKREFIGSKWTTEKAENKQPDPFKDFLDNEKQGTKWDAKALIDYGLQWEHSMGKTTIKLAYTLQLIPNGKGETVVELRTPFKPGMWSVKDMKFKVAEFMELIAWLKVALPRFGLPAEPTPMKIPVASECLLAVPEFAHLIQEKGADLPWPALPQYVAPASQAVTPVPQPAPAIQPAVPQAVSPAPQSIPAVQTAAPQAEKFCMHCGNKIPAQARFCPKCGGSQP